jgi:hypothetical protein
LFRSVKPERGNFAPNPPNRDQLFGLKLKILAASAPGLDQTDQIAVLTLCISGWIFMPGCSRGGPVAGL